MNHVGERLTMILKHRMLAGAGARLRSHVCQETGPHVELGRRAQALDHRDDADGCIGDATDNTLAFGAVGQMPPPRAVVRPTSRLLDHFSAVRHDV